MTDLSELPAESEEERLRRETRDLYDELVTRGAITGTYAEWLAAAAEEAAEKMAAPKPEEKPLVQVVRGALRK